GALNSPVLTCATLNWFLSTSGKNCSLLGGTTPTKPALTTLLLTLSGWVGQQELAAKVEEEARRSLLTRFLERQLHADRILTQSSQEYISLQFCTDLEPTVPMRPVKRSNWLEIGGCSPNYGTGTLWREALLGSRQVAGLGNSVMLP
ncbi:hypothetical protein THAOC_23005, partial [Thalassiosira oceanica]